MLCLGDLICYQGPHSCGNPLIKRVVTAQPSPGSYSLDNQRSFICFRPLSKMFTCYLLLLTMQYFSLWGYTSIKYKIVPKRCKLSEMHQSVDKKARKSQQEYLHTQSQSLNAKPFLQDLLLKKKIAPQNQDLTHSHWDSPGSCRFSSPKFTSPSQLGAAGKLGPAPVPRDFSGEGEQLGKLMFNLQTYKWLALLPTHSVVRFSSSGTRAEGAFLAPKKNREG